MRILFLICFFIVSKVCFGQYPITQNLASDSTVVSIGRNSNGAIKGGLINLSAFDTTAANSLRIKAYPGAMLATTSDSLLWMRSPLGNKWIQVIINSGGGGAGDTLYWRLGGNNLAIASVDYPFGTTSSNDINIITNNTLRAIVPSGGFAQITDTTANKVMTFNPTTKVWGYGNWYGSGGGGGTPNLQQVTDVGNSTTNDINLTSGAVFQVTTGDFEFARVGLGQLDTRTTLTGSRTWHLPDSTGTIALLQNINNIYNSDGTLTGSRVVDMGGNDLEFTNGASYNISLSDQFQISAGSGASAGIVEVNSSSATIQGAISGRSGQFIAYGDSLKINPPAGTLFIDTLLNNTAQNQLLGWTSTSGSNRGKVGYVTIGSGLSLSSGTLTATATTPGLQQVITQDPVLTSSNTINSSGNELRIRQNGTSSSSIQLLNDRLILSGRLANSGGQIDLNGDTVKIEPGQGLLIIDTLNSGVGTKALRYNPTTGRVTYADTTASGVTTVGTFSGSSQTNGASISGSTITFGPADGTNPGMVSTGTQTFAGVKTLTSNPIVTTSGNSNIAIKSTSGANSSEIDLEPAAFTHIYLNANNSGTFSIQNGARSPLMTILGATGRIGIGSAITAPTAMLHLPAGTASASTAPSKFTSGTLNTTAEAGAREFNGAFYDTKTSGLRYASGGVIADFTSTVDNSGTGETDLYTYTTPASTLAATGEKINATYGGTFNDLTATGQLQCYFGGTNIANTGALTISATGGWSMTVTIIRTGASTARALVHITTPGASTALYTNQTDLTGLTFTNTNIIKITGTAGGGTGGSGDISAKLGTISWYGSAAN